ncbi:MAG: penicillin-insensitive murein endopeptidase, partial [Candidatus Micrarchaeota archaeon]|nr:penicillin-insensitive murein endopeptidase [Candidatus Micrarchaeota archaeon]
PRRPRGGHTRGLDADVAYMCTDGSKVEPCFSPDRFNAPATWTVVKTLAKYGDAQYIFLDQALIDKLKTYAQSNEPGPFTNGIFEGNSKLIRHWPGHSDHLHIRLRCPKDDTQCIEQAGGYRKPDAVRPIEEIDETLDATEPDLTS